MRNKTLATTKVPMSDFGMIDFERPRGSSSGSVRLLGGGHASKDDDDPLLLAACCFLDRSILFVILYQYLRQSFNEYYIILCMYIFSFRTLINVVQSKTQNQ